MAVAYMANIGTRDVTLDGQILPKPRPDGERLLREYKEVRERLDAPILRPGIERALSHARRLEWLVLFVSDQPETVPADHRERDTLFIGELLRRWLIEHERFGTLLGSITVERLPGNPSDYNGMIPFFAHRLPKLIAPDTTDLVYIAPVGGADASNVGLLLAAVRTYKRKCQPIYVLPDGKVNLLELHRELLSDYARHQANTLLTHYDYAALGQLLEEEQLGPPWLPDIAAAAHYWLHFDFQRAWEALERARVRAYGEDRYNLDRLSASVEPFRRNPPTDGSSDEDWKKWLEVQRTLPRWQLSELFWNLTVKRERQEWVDFLGRLFRMHEALLRLCFEEETGQSTEKQEGKGFANFVAGVEKDPKLVTYLSDKGIDYDEPTGHVLGRVLDFWVEHAGKGVKYGKVQALLRIIDRLSELRNKSIIAHGYRGVSREDIEAIIGLDDLLLRLIDALDSLGVPTAKETNPFSEIQQLLTRGLR